MNKQEIFTKVEKLYNMWKKGMLGGEFMPEDSNPGLPKESLQNYLYFTLPMALNYQRNSYKLWESAKSTYLDKDTNFVFDIDKVLASDINGLKNALTKYKLALQPNKQTGIWQNLCKTIKEHFNGDIRNLFKACNYDVNKIRNYIQIIHKKDFPYLSGIKICNYWLFVTYQYTDVKYINHNELTVAPDTHVVKATHKLGLITDDEFNKSNIQSIVVSRWNDLLKGRTYSPIDIHTPLWLWSRNGFKKII